jgi:hypothetical protein
LDAAQKNMARVRSNHVFTHDRDAETLASQKVIKEQTNTTTAREEASHVACDKLNLRSADKFILV